MTGKTLHQQHSENLNRHVMYFMCNVIDYVIPLFAPRSEKTYNKYIPWNKPLTAEDTFKTVKQIQNFIVTLVSKEAFDPIGQAFIHVLGADAPELANLPEVVYTKMAQAAGRRNFDPQSYAHFEGSMDDRFEKVLSDIAKCPQITKRQIFEIYIREFGLDLFYGEKSQLQRPWSLNSDTKVGATSIGILAAAHFAANALGAACAAEGMLAKSLNISEAVACLAGIIITCLVIARNGSTRNNSYDSYMQLRETEGFRGMVESERAARLGNGPINGPAQ